MAANDERTRTDLVRISGSGASAVMGRIDIVSEQPSGGTIQITENGVYDVTEYSEADVQVEGLVPTGTKNITANGTYDVASFAFAQVSIPIYAGSVEVVS